MFIIWCLLFLTIVFYWMFIHHFKYWKNRGIPYPSISYLFGNVGETLTLTKTLGQVFTQIYNDYPNVLYIGFFKLRKPAILLRDPELIKKVLIKDFGSFHDNEFEIDKDVDPLGGRNTFCLRGNEWKVSKSQISPCFTTKKLKEMSPLVEEVLSKLINYIEKESVSISKNGIEARELSSKFTTDVVASCAFGLEGKSFDEPNPKFREMGQKIMDPSVRTIIKNLLLTIFPPLANILKVPFVPAEVAEYFIQITKRTIEYREKNGIVRNDFLDFIKELKKKENNFHDIDITAHALGFFVDGYVTSASALSHALFEIAAHTDVQEKLLLEIQNALKQTNGKIEYDTITDMKYLDLIFNETLRMHPPVMVLYRIVTEPTTLPNPNGSGPDKPIEVGTPICVPICSIQNDPKYFFQPEVFNPDRFENNLKEYRNKCIFLPFGEGPRSCHGQRFGLMQVKLAIVHIVKTYEVKVNKKTIAPLVVDPAYLVTHAKGGIWLDFEKRQH